MFLSALSASDADQASQLVAAFLTRRSGPSELAKAIRSISLAEPIAAAAIRRASSSGPKGQPLVDALANNRIGADNEDETVR